MEMLGWSPLPSNRAICSERAALSLSRERHMGNALCGQAKALRASSSVRAEREWSGRVILEKWNGFQGKLRCLVFIVLSDICILNLCLIHVLYFPTSCTVYTASDPLELELQLVVNLLIGCWEQISVPLQEPTGHLSSFDFFLIMKACAHTCVHTYTHVHTRTHAHTRVNGGSSLVVSW